MAIKKKIARKKPEFRKVKVAPQKAQPVIIPVKPGEPIPTPEKDRETINKFLQDNVSYFTNLYYRWYAERSVGVQYLGQEVAAKLPKGFVMEGMSTTPFGFKFRIESGALYMVTACPNVKWNRLS